jgi:tetratricopeptide (TPR) repeat protein
MSTKRPAVLMAILLLVIAGWLAWPVLQERIAEKPADAPRPPAAPLPAANALSALTVTREADGRWLAHVEYAYTGNGGPYAKLVVFHMVHTSAIGATGPTEWFIASSFLKPGTHRISIPVTNPSTAEAYVTEKIGARLDLAPAAPITVLVEQRIQWPDPVGAEVEKALAAGKPEEVVQKAVGQIDKAVHTQDLKEPRKLLEALVARSPRTDAAYVELARVAMKGNWGPVGLREAETLIGSALQINPASVNAKVLLGYVYAHQGRFREAEALFAQAAAANPPNLWLWANWGEALAMQGKAPAAIEKYREAIARPPTGDTYDRARWDAYEKLLVLLDGRKDVAAMDGALKKRAQEYPDTLCFAVDYARFLVLHRADIQGAVTILGASPSPGCNAGRRREVQGLGYYVAWSQGSDPERAEALRQARVFAPVSPSLFYTLASTERGFAVARQLVSAGEQVGMRDERELDALAYALRNGDAEVVRRLLRLGAKPTAEVGPEKMPAALIPVLTRDFSAIRMLQQAGVDYAQLRYQGTTALEYARKEGDTRLQRALDPKAGSL